MKKFTATGRFPSEPRIQNIPIRTPEGKAIRDALIQERCSGHIARDDNPKVCRHCGVHIDELRS